MSKKCEDGMCFRVWLSEKWAEHCDELLNYKIQKAEDYNSEDYFRKYKWWLKREYQNQKKRQMT